MNDFGEVCYVVSKHETHNAVPLHKIHYIFCSKNGNVIMEVDNGFSYERKHVSAINIHQIDLFSQYIFEIYEHREHGKIIAKENLVPGKYYFKGNLIRCILEIIKNNWWDWTYDKIILGPKESWLPHYTSYDSIYRYFYDTVPPELKSEFSLGFI